MKRENCKNEETKVISFTKYYGTVAVSALIGSVLWISAYAVDRLLPISNESVGYLAINGVLSVLILCLILLVHTKMFVVSAMRDKEDELYKENKAKTDRLFLTILYYMALVIVGLGIFMSGVQITFHYQLVMGVIWSALALYHFIALHYEKIGADEDETE